MYFVEAVMAPMLINTCWRDSASRHLATRSTHEWPRSQISYLWHDRDNVTAAAAPALRDQYIQLTWHSTRAGQPQRRENVDTDERNHRRHRDEKRTITAGRETRRAATLSPQNRSCARQASCSSCSVLIVGSCRLFEAI